MLLQKMLQILREHAHQYRNKKATAEVAWLVGGDEGIRTLDTAHHRILP